MRCAHIRELGSGLPRLFLLEDEYKDTIAQAELRWLDGIIADLRRKKLAWNRTWIEKVARRMGRPAS